MPAVFQLLAFPGTGKLTIGREIKRQLEARGEPCALLDNHATHNLVWQLVPEHRRFDEPVLAAVFELRRVLIEAAGEVTSPDHSIIFTNFLPPAREPTIVDPHRTLAQKLGKRLVAVELRCDRDVVLSRVENPDRVANMKLSHRDSAMRVMDAGQTLPTHWPELTSLDVTTLSAEEAAARIVAMADSPD